YIRTARSRNSSEYFLGAAMVDVPLMSPIRPSVNSLRISGEPQAADGHATDPSAIPAAAALSGPVVLGLDTDSPDDTLLAFAFEAAARHVTPLRVVHVWNLPPYFAYGVPADPELDAVLGKQDAATLAEVLHRWKEKYPAVEVVAESRSGSPAIELADASREASLVVVGRRVRRSPLGAHIGPVTHAVLHHAAAPVAVISHD
ncbi:universal stress protein, partial [Streptomyces sp. A30]|uniref:universal stress protein n=1 Tax=Streptomyces sp. A30 TaxID=2789273 RepID=UPI003980A707